MPEYRTRTRLRFNEGDTIYVVDSITGENISTYKYSKKDGKWIKEGEN